MRTTEIELLEHIIKSTEMGMDGINNILEKAGEKKLRDELKSEYAEYEDIHRDAAAYLSEMGEAPKGINTFSKVSSQMMTELETAFDTSSSKLADMMIKGTTMGVTKSIKLMNSYDGDDMRIKNLCGKLRKLEENRINRLKTFL